MANDRFRRAEDELARVRDALRGLLSQMDAKECRATESASCYEAECAAFDAAYAALTTTTKD